MRKFVFPVLVLLIWASCSTSNQSVKRGGKASDSTFANVIPQPTIYRATYTRFTDLVHTKLEIVPDWTTKQVNGKATLTLHPHFYDSDSVFLNARGMDLHEVALLNKDNTKSSLVYAYADDLLRIKLDRSYKKEENFSIYIRYTAKPEELKQGGSRAIQNDKGFYFINADGKNPDKPKEFWTQGETESNSGWFPTIESPDQRMTQEIYLTVDSAFETLSNGLLLSTQINGDRTKTDYWKQSLPNAPYLTMVAAGDFAIIKDRWRNIEVSYYVDKPYEKYARLIFGNTPEMLEFFSKKLNVDYVWEKYSQIVVHDYVSGAMENTTAVVHGTNMLEDARELMDYNYEDYISHELFHHWFGNLVTCESWSNLTLNEGFANYSEYLWREYKYGRDDADYSNQGEQSAYLLYTAKNDPTLIRYDYEDREDMYDVVSYQKGGRVLHMLRKYVGDDAFYAALKLYLDARSFNTAEIADLRMAFEHVTGEDLNWFFDQWFLKAGRPTLEISYNWDEVSMQETILLEQTQDFSKNPLYRIPLDVDIYAKGKVEQKKIVLDSAKQEFVFTLSTKPDLVNVDAEKMLLCTKKENKEKQAYVFQFYHAPLYLDRFEALSFLSKEYRSGSEEAGVVMDALKDPFWKIRLTALDNISELAKNIPDSILPVVRKLAKADSSSDVREAAYRTLGKYFRYQDLVADFENGLKDSSYQVNARVFKIVSEKDAIKAAQIAKNMEADSSSDIFNEITNYYSLHPEENHVSYFSRAIGKSKGWNRYQVINNFGKYLAQTEENVMIEGLPVLEYFGTQLEKRHLKNAINNCYKAIQTELKSKIEKKEAELKEGEKNKMLQAERSQLERSIQNLKELKDKVSNSQDKLAHGADK